MLKGIITPPGDKSITHRGIILGALAVGQTTIHNMLLGEDCLNTMSIFRQLGVNIEVNGETTVVSGVGLNGLKKSDELLYCGNSGTTIRLLSGVLAGQEFSSTITGDDSIQRRPMKRVIKPLGMMNAKIKSQDQKAPLSFEPSALMGIEYLSPIASAQVKSAILLAGLYAHSTTTVIEPAMSRNHTELMLESFGANIITDKLSSRIFPNSKLYARELFIPGDISSAAFFMVAALITKGSDIIIKNVGVNDTRAGILKVLKQMKANIDIEDVHCCGKECVADIHVRYTPELEATTLGGDLIPTLIDEIPIIALLATQAEGKTVINDIGELRVKECDRIDAMEKGLTAAGVAVHSTENSLTIMGKASLGGTKIETFHDHRIAMTFTIASLISDKPFELSDDRCIDISYPSFSRDLENLLKN